MGMDIKRYIQKSIVVDNLKAETKEQAIKEMVEAVYLSQPKD